MSNKDLDDIAKTENKTLPVLNINNLHGCVNAMKQFSNKGVANGVYDLQEVEKILFCLNAFSKCIDTLDSYQTYLTKKATIKDTT